MNRIIADLVLLFLSCIICSVFYWQIFYPVILKRIRFHLFEMRDEARTIAAERGLADDFVFQDIEHFICKTIAIAPSINLMSFIWFATHQVKRLDNKEYDQFSNEAPEEFVKMREATSRDAVFIMMLNSPWEILFVLVPAPVLWAFGKISRLGIYREAEDFVENIQVGVNPQPQCA